MADVAMVPTPIELTKAGRKPDLVRVPDHVVISVDGDGGPSVPAFAEAIQALYAVGYTLRFSRKGQGRPVFKVGPLVGEWRAEGVSLEARALPDPKDWRWSLRIGVPADATGDDLDGAIHVVAERPKSKLQGNAQARRIELRTIEEASFVRILHVGPYATEPESFEKLGAFLAERGLRREPWHLEVYLSDPGRTAPEKLKTALLAPLVELS